MKKTFLILVVALILTSCGQVKEGFNKDKVKALDFVKYKITVPATWKKFKMDGFDSSITGIIIDKNDTIYLSYGVNHDGFNETVIVHPIKSKAHFDSINWEFVDEMVFSDNSTVEERQGVYLDEYYMIDTIDSRRAKIMPPKIPGSGGVGIHFSEVNSKGEKLSMYAENMDSLTHWQLYKVFKTIKFK